MADITKNYLGEDICRVCRINSGHLYFDSILRLASNKLKHSRSKLKNGGNGNTLDCGSNHSNNLRDEKEMRKRRRSRKSDLELVDIAYFILAVLFLIIIWALFVGKFPPWAA